MKARSKARMKKRREKYVLGYIGAGNTVYGKVRGGDYKHYGPYTDPMSLKAAKACLATMPCADCAIFELVPVAVNR